MKSLWHPGYKNRRFGGKRATKSTSVGTCTLREAYSSCILVSSVYFILFVLYFLTSEVRLLGNNLILVLKESLVTICTVKRKTLPFSRLLQFDLLLNLNARVDGPFYVQIYPFNQRRLQILTQFILLHETFLQFDWFRAVVFELNLKYLHVKITNLVRVVV